MSAAKGIDDLSEIEEIESVWIPMRDGVRLAARLWLPKTAHTTPVPGILEYIPYRKRDFMRLRDEPIHRYYALKGFASIRVDIRGSGDSEGMLDDEYSETELQDALTIIEWISNQPWCSGAIGMTGISWGGFNALQVAALRPPSLKAIITLCASDDRYSDDAHYKGGCLLNENMQWGSILMLYNALPPDPEVVGENWRRIWRQRIDAVRAFPAVWMGHSSRDAYWQHGSICEDYDAIDCPVFAIGGWADGYTNAVPRLLEGLDVPRKGLIGPWAHAFPHDAVPGPQIGYLQEAVRWWRHWLLGEDEGLMDEPMLRAWMQDAVPPQPQYEFRPGRWVAEEEWPSRRIRKKRWNIDWGNLTNDAAEIHEISFSSPQTLGVRGGEWCGFGADGEAPRDQRADDGGSVVFDSEPFLDTVELLGSPRLELDLKSDQEVAFLIARLCLVDPKGSSARISYGILNLCHIDGHEQPKPLNPGEWRRLSLEMDVLGQQVPAGYRLRLGLSTSYWPMIWPSPTPAVLTLRTGKSWLELPIRPPADEDRALRKFDEPEAAQGSQYNKLEPSEFRRMIEIDLATNEMVYTLRGDGGEFGGASVARIEEIDLELGYHQEKQHRIVEEDPLSAKTEFEQFATLRRGDWNVRLDCRTLLSATRQSFEFSGELKAFENDDVFAERQWTVSIPRHFL